MLDPIKEAQIPIKSTGFIGKLGLHFGSDNGRNSVTVTKYLKLLNHPSTVEKVTRLVARAQNRSAAQIRNQRTL